MSRAALLLLPLVAVSGLALSGLAHATLPLNPEDYPDCGEEDCEECCPRDLDAAWDFISYVPIQSREDIRPAERALGSGMWVDRAWRTTMGRTDVLVAIGDSGVNWANGRLVRKWFLNAEELPLPQTADGEDAAEHDLNGDGVFNIDDWAEDPRVDITAGEDVADGMLDPSDLIATFSDGVDDDGNGYTDDISGWDFFGRDNNAYHTYADGYGTHGDGVAETAAAEGDDEDGGDIGVCPNCMILPVRLGDTFVTDGGRAAESMLFAADSGAVSMSLAVGALTNPDTATAAAKYAFEHGLTLVGAAGDENAYHHNFPAMLDNVVYTHSIRHNTINDESAAYSYSNTWNCNNYGARLTVVAPSSACATGAVAMITGMVGLLQSVAKDEGTVLHPGEVAQLLEGTADDIWLPEAERVISNAYPSDEGWDAFYGYGRVNAAHAVEAVVAGEIPPWVSISSPTWFAQVDPMVSPQVLIEGTISAERAGSYSYIVEVGRGHDPRDWTQIGDGSGSGVETGVLATLDLESFAWKAPLEADVSEGIMGRIARAHENQLTVRVRVTDDSGLMGEQRKAFAVNADPDLLPGWPVQLPGSAESSPRMADLDGDGIFEIIVGTSDGRVTAFNGAGDVLPGWPVQTDVVADFASGGEGAMSGEVPPLHDAIIAAVAVGDLDGDGENEVVATTFGGFIYAWSAAGDRLDGFPVQTIGRAPEEFSVDNTWDQGFVGAPALFDLDDDGTLEIIAAAMDQRLYVFTGDGENWGPYPIEACHPLTCGVQGRRIITSPAIGDVDNDGDYEIAIGSNEAPNDGRMVVSHLFDANTGLSAEGWPRADVGLVNESVLLPLLGEGHPASMAFADIDGDGDLEIGNPIIFGTGGLMAHDGTVALALPHFAEAFPEGTNVDDAIAPAMVQFVTNPAFGDMTGDGTPDYVLGGASAFALVALALTEWVEFQQMVCAWDGATGELLPGWPRQIEDFQFLLAPVIADLSGDGMPEAAYGSAGYLVHAWDAAGIEAPGFPKNTGQWILGSPSIGDVDGDGYLDLAVSTREGMVFVWTTLGRADQTVQWQSQFHDPQNTGNYEMPLTVQAGPVPEAEENLKAELAGCGCARGSGAALAFLPLFGLGWARRRRRA